MLRRRTVIDVDAVRAAVQSAAGQVEDPEIHQPLAELGMLGDVRVSRTGHTRIQVRLTTAACPLKTDLGAAVATAVRSVPGVSTVEVDFDVMPPHQRMRLAGQLRSHTGDGPRGYGSRASVVAVASGKGGVGKSTITANLAASLAADGQRVGILDADVWGHSIPQLFGVDRPPVAMNGMMLPIEAHGVRLMSTGFFVDDEPIVWRGPMLDKALQQFFDDVYWGELDVLFVDLPPGTGDVALTLLGLVPHAQLVVVTTPQLAAQRVAYRAGRMAADARMRIAGVVENMSAAESSAESAVFGTGGGARLAEQLATPLLGRVPLDVILRRSGDAGVPAVIGGEESAATGELGRIAGAIDLHRPTLVGRHLPIIPT
ncbi:Mrp/NBP35 family ATP-binding protein [Phytoactinopolyspora mesophila]|uniref:Iron-sulfur cluster carrier protein n=1 Tax=Phytoactinopolyspora mesophila TaxID=2650750 RepID=A0A7K3MDL3_9ACTN|nr:Mrp/NBP35 family ATP-binding protein [Phytoactinopolyspora mesophila]NDL61092.1 P-loop NTPase [Phytoactinopolyspora mesophila]